MKRLRRRFRQLPGPIRWSIVGAMVTVALGLVAAPFEFIWDVPPAGHLGDFLIGAILVGAVAGLVHWWRWVGFRRYTGLEPSWLIYILRRRRERRRRGAAIEELRTGIHPRAVPLQRGHSRPKR